MTKPILDLQPQFFNEIIWDNLTNYKSATEVWYGGASSGKSHGVIQKIVIKSLRNWKHPRRVLFLRKVGATIRDSIFEDVLQCLSFFGVYPFVKVNRSDFRITFPNGAVFIFKGMDDPEKIKSIKGISDVVMEEATEFTLDDYTQLTLRVREKKHPHKQIYMMFNPVSKANWVYQYFFTRSLDGVSVYHTTYKDNRFLDEITQKTIEDLATRNEAYYKIYALGQFATLDKLIYRYESRLLDRSSLAKLPSYFGLDFGYINDPSAFIHVKVDEENKTLYIIEEYVKKAMLNDEIARMIVSLGYQKESITADSAEQKSIAEIKRLGVNRIKPAVKGPDSIIQGISFIQQYKLVVDERCPKVIEELQNYTWLKDKKTSEYINKPIDSFNHTLDALRYALEPINGKGYKAKAGIIKRRI